MNLTVISIGSELLVGHTVNTNFAYIGEQLSEAGHSVSREVCIPDVPGVIADTVVAEMAAADVVVTIGGLGPTRDDMTRQVIAEALGMELEFRADVLAHIQAYLACRKVYVPSAALRVQAMVPSGATVLMNANGTAPGLWCATEGGIVAMLPGPPREFRPMFDAEVLPRLQAAFAAQGERRILRVCGVPESILAERVERLLTGGGIELAYCARPVMVDLRLTVAAGGSSALDEAVGVVREEFGEAVLPDGEANVVASIGNILRDRGWWLAAAESCTGGGIGATVTAEPGASDFFKGSLVCYADDWKESVLGVRPATLAESGAVSAETAGQMVEGLFERYGVDAAVAVTGIAGPSGGSEDKPVGLVFIGVGVRGAVTVHRHVFPGSRETVQQRTISVTLNQLRMQLLNWNNPA